MEIDNNKIITTMRCKFCKKRLKYVKKVHTTGTTKLERTIYYRVAYVYKCKRCDRYFGSLKLIKELEII